MCFPWLGLHRCSEILISHIWFPFILFNLTFPLSQFLLELKETVLGHKYFLKWPYILPSTQGDKPFLTALSCSSCLNCYLLLTRVSTNLLTGIVIGYTSVFHARTRVLWTVSGPYNNFLFVCVCLVYSHTTLNRPDLIFVCLCICVCVFHGCL